MIGSIRGQTMTATGGSSAAATSNATTRSAGVGQEPAATAETGKTATDGSSTQKISTLARQLADSAARAEERDRTLSRKELAAKAESIIDQIAGDSYTRNKEKNDSEVPKTDDPELLARAKAATAYLHSTWAHGINCSKKNPFAGLSDEQLTLITYDDKGSYTVNERHAAWLESYDRHQAWCEKVCANAMVEYHNTGKNTELYKACIENYNGLPLIEQVQYPPAGRAEIHSDGQRIPGGRRRYLPYPHPRAESGGRSLCRRGPDPVCPGPAPTPQHRYSRPDQPFELSRVQAQPSKRAAKRRGPVDAMIKRKPVIGSQAKGQVVGSTSLRPDLR